jgi:23S rRNA pseudouridine1911/1915/1917 synthase
MEDQERNALYENDKFAVYDKPDGVLFDWVLDWRPKLIPVHRLDKDTSGVILFAKSESSADYLRKLFEERKIKKTYIALVVGHVKNKEGTINIPIARSTKDFRKHVAFGGQGKEREAETNYHVEKYFGDFTLLTVTPRSGRTHQIRAHLASIGYPIVCDSLYGGKRGKCPPGISRQFLHAASIEFIGEDGAQYAFDADLPTDLGFMLTGLSNL